jgi:acetoin utilization deacetylase AcuC-like enzyme
MGFCLFNNIALAAQHARQKHQLSRILIVDWDVHHGNGTQDVFYEDPEVFFLSIHRYGGGFYPGTGAATDFGSGTGEGFIVNLPVPPGSGSDEFLSLIQAVVTPIARQWRPGLLCISAGYDAHRDDPLANCEVDDAGYGDMAATMRDLASELGVPVLICLEGGYSLGALSRSVVATLEAFSADREPRPAPPEPAAPYRQRLARFWPVLEGPT